MLQAARAAASFQQQPVPAAGAEQGLSSQMSWRAGGPRAVPGPSPGLAAGPQLWLLSVAARLQLAQQRALAQPSLACMRNACKIAAKLAQKPSRAMAIQAAADADAPL